MACQRYWKCFTDFKPFSNEVFDDKLKLKLLEKVGKCEHFTRYT